MINNQVLGRRSCSKETHARRLFRDPLVRNCFGVSTRIQWLRLLFCTAKMSRQKPFLPSVFLALMSIAGYVTYGTASSGELLSTHSRLKVIWTSLLLTISFYPFLSLVLDVLTESDMEAQDLKSLELFAVVQFVFLLTAYLQICLGIIMFSCSRKKLRSFVMVAELVLPAEFPHRAMKYSSAWVVIVFVLFFCLAFLVCSANVISGKGSFGQSYPFLFTSAPLYLIAMISSVSAACFPYVCLSLLFPLFHEQWVNSLR